MCQEKYSAVWQLEPIIRYQEWNYRIPLVKVIVSLAYRIPTRREFLLINLSDKAVVDVYLLFPAAIRAFYSFVHHDFLNQGV